MSEWWLPTGTAIIAVALTYVFCVRPMRRGHCASTGQTQNQGTEQLDQVLNQARNELARIRTGTRQEPPAPRGAPPLHRDPMPREHQ